jgi:hypothetical protein
MDTTLNTPGSATLPAPTAFLCGSVADDAKSATAAPVTVETPRAVPAADAGPQAAFKQAAPNSALTTYKDQDSGRIIVRVYDRENGDILVEFPPEKSFRTVEEVLQAAGLKPKQTITA